MKQITILACLFVLPLVLQNSTEHVVGTDPYYRAQVSMLRGGLFSKHFEWTQASLFKDHFADKEFLFHIFLMPFTALGELTGAKVATAFFSS